MLCTSLSTISNDPSCDELCKKNLEKSLPGGCRLKVDVREVHKMNKWSEVFPTICHLRGEGRQKSEKYSPNVYYHASWNTLSPLSLWTTDCTNTLLCTLTIRKWLIKCRTFINFTQSCEGKNILSLPRIYYIILFKIF